MPDLSIFSKAFSRARRWCHGLTLSQWALAGLLLLIIIAAAIYLDEGPKPWGKYGIQAAEAKGARVRTSHVAITTFWWTTLVALVGCSGLLIASPWLARPLKEPLPASEEKKKPPFSWKWIGVSVLGSMVVASWFSIPRLDDSLWFDEEYMLRVQVSGDYIRRDENGRTSLLGTPTRYVPNWRELLWFYRMPNNHPPVAIMGRIGQALFAKDLTPERPRGYYFNEAAYRFPSWVAGMLSLAAIAAMLAQFGCFRAALVAPWFLALHPWFIRYASEARGYVFLFLFGPLCVMALLRAMRNGGWRWWSLFGICEFLYLYFNSSPVYVLVFLNLGALAYLAFRKDIPGTDRLTLGFRWLTVNALAGLLFVQMMAPCFVQLSRDFRPNPMIADILGPELMADMASSVATGMLWWCPEPNHPWLPELSETCRNHPAAVIAFLGALVLFLIAGSVHLWRKGGLFRGIVAAFLLSVPVFYGHAFLKGLQLYVWYIIFCLPLLWSLAMAGLEPVADAVGRRLGGRSGAVFAVISLAMLGAFSALTWDQRAMTRAHPTEPARESVELTREIVNPFAAGFDEVITVGFNKYTRAYDPGYYQAGTTEDFLTLLKMADETGKPLYVNYAMPGLAERGFPGIMEIVNDETRFEQIATLYGLEPNGTRWVRKYIPGSVK